MHLLIISVIIFVFLATNGECCTYLTAYSSGSTLESHTDYGSHNYDNNENRCWVITTSSFSGHVIKVNADSFNLEYHASCNYDYLKIYDSAFSYGSYNTYCGYNGDFEIFSSGSSLYLEFDTDGSNTYDGFSLTYSEVADDDAGYTSWTNSYTTYNSDYTGIVDDIAATAIGIATIIGIVVGVIILLAIVVGVVICVVVCCIVGQSGKRTGGTVRPTGTRATVMMQQQQQQRGGVSYVNNGAYGQAPGGAVMVQPPAYGGQQQQYGYANPAYGGPGQGVQPQYGAPPPPYPQNQQQHAQQQPPQQQTMPMQSAPTAAAPFSSDAGVPPPPVYNDPPKVA